ncbi:MAG: teicoplanin resistance protein VanZ [Sulfuricurvum sp. RIFCSPLOWO2_02_43_6]|nr:MAG: teicoplanin resistance protein VanZ [Sulfuricurvum sp. RIFCSPLOWO2_02_43_6]
MAQCFICIHIDRVDFLMKINLFKTAFYSSFLGIEYLAITPQHIKIVESFWDKQNHFIAFCTLYVLLSLAYKHLSTRLKVVLLVLVGFQIEITQYFIPNRFFSLMDIVADCIGIVIGIGIYRVISKIKTPL